MKRKSWPAHIGEFVHRKKHWARCIGSQCKWRGPKREYRYEANDDWKQHCIEAGTLMFVATDFNSQLEVLSNGAEERSNGDTE